METKKKRGPQSERGRAVSSMNALRIGVYSNALLDGESQEQVEAMVDELVREWPAAGAEQRLSAQLYVQCALKSARLHAAEVAITNSRMHSEEVRDSFCHRAGLPLQEAGALPDWYLDVDPAPRAEAMRLGRVLSQAHKLLGSSMMHYGSSVRDHLPDLWAEVMGADALVSKLTLVERLGKLYEGGRPEEVLRAFIEDYRERYKYELLWALQHRRFGAIVEGLRAGIMIDVATKEHWQKTDAMLHRRRLELSQHVHAIARARSVLEPPQAIEAQGGSPMLAEPAVPPAGAGARRAVAPGQVQDVKAKAKSVARGPDAERGE